MEGDLRTFIRQTRSTLTWNSVYNIFWAILSNLHELHAAKRVHKDLHGENILRRSDGSWFLANFGMSRPANKGIDKIFGNMAYMSPEIIRGKPYTAAADIY